MDNFGELLLSSMWQWFQQTLTGFWGALLANPWLFLVLGFIVAGSLYLQLTPRRRRSRAR